MAEHGGDLDEIPMVSLKGGLRAYARWVVLGALLTTQVTIALVTSASPTGETLGAAFAPLLFGALIGGAVWLLVGRKVSVFASTFFWVATILSALALVGLLGRLAQS